jgi:hypothetical protein
VIRLATLVLLAAFAAGGSGAPVATSPPTIAGTLQQGNRLTANPGTWSARDAIKFTYQWYRCGATGSHCSSIHGATRATYTQVGADVGHSLAVTVEASAGSGSAVAYAPLAGLVAAKSAPFAAAAQPALEGEAFIGRSLSVSAVRWTAAAPTATVRWLRCNANGRLCTAIDRAGGVSYTVAAADAGHVLLAVVTASKQSVLSASSAVVRSAPGPLALSRPAIGGPLRVGSKLRGDAGVWSGGGTISYAYQWYRCNPLGARCTTLRGATKNTFTATTADEGHTIALTVRASDSTGVTSAYSSLAGVLAAADSKLAAKTQPTVDGVAAIGRELRVSDPSFTTKPGSIAYAWLRCTPSVRNCAPIAGADRDAYTVTKDDAGHALVASVTAVAAGERQVTLSTAATIAG